MNYNKVAKNLRLPKQTVANIIKKCYERNDLE